MTSTRIRDVMSTPVVTIDEDATYKQAVDLLLRNGIGALPVKNEQNAVIGVVSESDLLTKVALVDDAAEPGLLTPRRQRRAILKAASDRVTGLMSAPARTVSEDTSLPQAARLMQTHAIKHLPVLNLGGALTGIVARTDLLRDFLRSDERIRADVLHQVIEGALAADPTEFEVTVHNGIVSIAGPLESATMIPIAGQLIRSVGGVVDVVNKLTTPARKQPVRSAEPRWFA